jgi:hypothetical protein
VQQTLKIGKGLMFVVTAQANATPVNFSKQLMCVDTGIILRRTIAKCIFF